MPKLFILLLVVVATVLASFASLREPRGEAQPVGNATTSLDTAGSPSNLAPVRAALDARSTEQDDGADQAADGETPALDAVVVRREEWASLVIDELKEPIRVRLSMLRGEGDAKPDPVLYGAAKQAATLAVEVIYCAEGKARPPVLPMEGESMEELAVRSFEIRESYGPMEVVYQSFCKSHLPALAHSRLTASGETALTHEGAVFARAG